MDGLLWFSLFFLSASATESLTKADGCLSQPSRVIWKKSGQSVVLSCTSRCTEPGVYEWFFVRENSHHHLNLLGSQKYNLTGTSLHIKSLQANDSGIYHCAWHGEPTHGKPHVALGTTLVVREKVGVMVLNILLWISFVLLAIYSLALTTFIIKKYGCLSVCGIRKTLKNTSTKRRHFSDVLQEIDRRNIQKRNKQAANFNEPTDDIYQNI